MARGMVAPPWRGLAGDGWAIRARAGCPPQALRRRSFAATRFATSSTGGRAEWAADEVLEPFAKLDFQHRLISKKYINIYIYI